jgi:hypothetical protein
MILLVIGALAKDLLSFNLSASVSSSPRSFTNPPNGSQFIDQIVSPIFLPQALGGRPNPNSSTFIPDFLAAK